MLLTEYEYWTSPQKTMKMPDGSMLTRYWDELEIPRDESFSEDLEWCSKCAPADCRVLYRDIRSAAESGWYERMPSFWIQSLDI